jgi:predicted metal-dependent hydrolase
MNNFVFNGLNITHILKPKLKHSYISITNEFEVVVKTPNVPKIYIENFLKNKESWIRKKLSEMEQNKLLEVNLEDEVALFGEIYSIDMPQAKALRDKLAKLKVNSNKNIINTYNIFYKEYSDKYITQRVEYFSKKMSLSYDGIKYRKMKSRWGSCNSNKILTFNTELIKVKKELIDYVVVHELAHLKYMNHSKTFHIFVDKFLPDSRFYRKELKNIRL